MTTAAHHHPGFEEYVFGLRQAFCNSAKDELSGLERMIDDGGYAWLDGYVDGIIAGSSKSVEYLRDRSLQQASRLWLGLLCERPGS